MIVSIVVVLYRKTVEESISVCSILGLLEGMKAAGFFPRIYIWNNSPGWVLPLVHEDVTWFEGDNVSLPLIYNEIADLAFSSGSSVLLISDDDTDYAKFDFESCFRVVEEVLSDGRDSQVGTFLPQIMSGGRLVSPGGRRLFKGYLFDQVNSGLIDSCNVLAINSGMIITKACYERMRPLYDARLNFYGTDTEFFVRYQRHFKKIYVLDSVVEHSLSSDTRESPDRAFFRWKDNINAMAVVFERESFAFKFLMRIYYALVKFKLFIKFRDWRFLKI